MNSIRIVIELIENGDNGVKKVSRHEIEAHALVAGQAEEYFADAQIAVDACEGKMRKAAHVLVTRTVSKRKPSPR